MAATPFSLTLSDHVRRYVGAGGRSLRSLAAATGIAPSQLSRWTTGGARLSPCSPEWLALCDELGLTRDQRRALALAAGLDPAVVFPAPPPRLRLARWTGRRAVATS